MRSPRKSPRDSDSPGWSRRAMTAKVEWRPVWEVVGSVLSSDRMREDYEWSTLGGATSTGEMKESSRLQQA
jgi:hypothetical protein